MTRVKPIRIRASPDQAVAADLHFVRLRKPNHFVALAKIVGQRIRPQDPPLHRVFGFHHIEFAGQGRGVGRLRKLRGANRRADEQSVASAACRRVWARHVATKSQARRSRQLKALMTIVSVIYKSRIHLRRRQESL